jgi:hypothetical protein
MRLDNSSRQAGQTVGYHRTGRCKSSLVRDLIKGGDGSGEVECQKVSCTLVNSYPFHAEVVHRRYTEPGKQQINPPSDSDDLTALVTQSSKYSASIIITQNILTNSADSRRIFSRELRESLNYHFYGKSLLSHTGKSRKVAILPYSLLKSAWKLLRFDNT